MRANASSPPSDSHGSAAAAPNAVSAVRLLTFPAPDSTAFPMGTSCADARPRSRTAGAAPQRDKSIAGDARPAFAPAVGPLDDDGADRRRGAEPEMHARVARRQVAAVGPYAAPQRRLPGALDAHQRADCEPVARPLVETHLQPVAASG